MIILDTNVVSEMMRATPNAAAFLWLNRQPVDQIYTTVITEAEILIGIALLPAGQRRDELDKDGRLLFDSDLDGRILLFDRAAAALLATIFSSRRRQGRPIEFADAQIAAIARSQNATLATRNTRDFTDCGIDLVDPWTA